MSQPNIMKNRQKEHENHENHGILGYNLTPFQAYICSCRDISTLGEVVCVFISKICSVFNTHMILVLRGGTHIKIQGNT